MEVKIKQMEELSLQSCIKLFVWDRINFHCWKKNLLVTQSYYAFKVIEDFFFFFYVSGSCEEQVQTTSRSSLMLWRSLLPRVEILPGARWLYRYPYVITRHAKFHNASGMTYSFSFHTNCCFRKWILQSFLGVCLLPGLYGALSLHPLQCSHCASCLGFFRLCCWCISVN